jgi:hypothetical protein
MQDFFIGLSLHGLADEEKRLASARKNTYLLLYTRTESSEQGIVGAGSARVEVPRRYLHRTPGED